MENDELFMNEAIEQAKRAAQIGEVPVGAVVVCDGKIVSAEFNTRETDKNALCHAEIKAIDAACRKLGGWRLHKCDIYVTLEPCPMCAGAIVNSRIKRVVYGAKDEKAGAFGTKLDLNACSLNHKPEIVPNVLGAQCAEMLTRFFSTLRENK
ncbi:MAG: nucleoside deaminase [Clostridia bacterium]|nr:nucleoside deaminase [Clostridia bacterium]